MWYCGYGDGNVGKQLLFTYKGDSMLLDQTVVQNEHCSYANAHSNYMQMNLQDANEYIIVLAKACKCQYM